MFLMSIAGQVRYGQEESFVHIENLRRLRSFHPASPPGIIFTLPRSLLCTHQQVTPATGDT